MTQEAKAEIVHVQDEGRGIQLAPIAAGMAAVQMRQQALDYLAKVVIPSTSKSSWADFDGKPFMDSNAAEKIARVAGISFNFDKPVKEKFADELGEYYIYTVQGVATLGSETVPDIGTCSSRDKFFGRKDGGYKPMSEVDEPSVMKKAIANFKGRVVKAILGLDGLTWEDLKKIDPTLTPENCGGGVKFKKERDDNAVDQKSGATLGELREAIRAMLLEVFQGDKKAAALELEKMTTFTVGDKTIQGKQQVEKLTDKQVPKTYGDTKKFYQEKLGKEFVLKPAATPPAQPANDGQPGNEGGVQ